MHADHDWEYERGSAEADAFEAYCAEFGWDLEDPEAIVWWEARKAAQEQAYWDARIDAAASAYA